MCQATGSLQQALPRWGGTPAGGLSSLPPREAWELLLSSLLGDFPAVWKGLFFRVIVGGECNTDGSVSLSLALLRCLFKCVRVAFQMVNVSVSNITFNKKKKFKK